MELLGMVLGGILGAGIACLMLIGTGALLYSVIKEIVEHWTKPDEQAEKFEAHLLQTSLSQKEVMEKLREEFPECSRVKDYDRDLLYSLRLDKDIDAMRERFKDNEREHLRRVQELHDFHERAHAKELKDA